MIQQFHKPASIQEALALKETHGDMITWFGGGAYLNHIDFKGKFNQVICLEQLQLNAIQQTKSHLEIGAGINLQAILDHEQVPDALKNAITKAAVRTIRNLSTLGGQIAIGGAKTKIAPCLIALKSTLELGDRTEVLLETYLNNNYSALISKIKIPLLNRTCKTLHLSHQANSETLVTVAASLQKDDDHNINEVIIAIGNLENHCRRLDQIEKTVQDRELNNFAAIQQAVENILEPKENLLGSIKYKKYAASHAVAECIMSCLDREEI